MKKQRVLRSVALSLLAAGAGAALWGTCVERHLYVLRKEHVPVLPEGTAPLKVLHLSDLHLAPWQTHRIEWIRSLAQHAPDLIVLTGDLMGHIDAREALRHALAPFKGTPGVFVHGSNDYYGPIFKNPIKYLRTPNRISTRVPDIDNTALTTMLTDDLGFIDLNNEAVDLPVHGSQLRFFGLNDPHIRYDNTVDMRTALHALDEHGPADVRFGVVHAPYMDSLDDLLKEDASVLFAGHTHGGQVRVPGFGALTSNSDLPPKQSRGLSVWFSETQTAFLHVSAGLGHSVYAPVRFACRPEATMLTLTARGVQQSAQC